MHTWTWLYTFLTVVCLLAVFATCCAVLLLRHSPRRWHRTPESIATPLGIADIKMKKMFAAGVERARKRNYVNPRGER